MEISFTAKIYIQNVGWWRERGKEGESSLRILFYVSKINNDYMEVPLLKYDCPHLLKYVYIFINFSSIGSLRTI